MKKLKRLKQLLETNYQSYQEIYYDTHRFSITIKRYGKYEYQYQLHDKMGWYSPDWNEKDTLSFLSTLNDVLDDKIIAEINEEIPEFELELNYLINLSIKNDDFYWLTGGNKNWHFDGVINSIYSEIENILSEDEEYRKYNIEAEDVDIKFLNPNVKNIYDDFLQFFKSHIDFRDVVNFLKKVKTLEDFQRIYKNVKNIINSIITEYIINVANESVIKYVQDLKKRRRK
jgi:hypothetical protein